MPRTTQATRVMSNQLDSSNLDADLTLNLLRHNSDAEAIILQSATPLDTGLQRRCQPITAFTDSPDQKATTKLFGNQTMQHYASF